MNARSRVQQMSDEELERAFAEADALREAVGSSLVREENQRREAEAMVKGAWRRAGELVEAELRAAEMDNAREQTPQGDGRVLALGRALQILASAAADDARAKRG